MNDQNDLSLISLPELTEEIKKRCDTGVILLQQNRTQTLTGIHVASWGDPFMLQGVLHSLSVAQLQQPVQMIIAAHDGEVSSD